MATTYDEHAEFQIARRRIDKAWIEDTLDAPRQGRSGRPGCRRRSALKCLPGWRVVLRVVTRVDHPSFVITAYFDRTRPCAQESIARRTPVYLNLTGATIHESEEVACGIVVDYDAEGRIVSVEILDASRRTGDPEALKEMSFELPDAV